MQHILFSVISAIIGINILVVSARQETNQIPAFEHYDTESIVDLEATPYQYKESLPIKKVEVSPIEEKTEPTAIDTSALDNVVSETPTATASATSPTITPDTITPTGTIEPSGILTPTATQTPPPSVTTTPSPTITPTQAVNQSLVIEATSLHRTRT